MRQFNKIFLGLSLYLLAFVGHCESNNQFVTNDALQSQMEHSKPQIAEVYKINSRMGGSKQGFARGSTQPNVVVCSENSGVRRTANGHGR